MTLRFVPSGSAAGGFPCFGERVLEMYQNRIERVLQSMAQQGMEQLLVFEPETLDYLIGWKCGPGERLLALLINGHGEVHLFVNHMFACPPQKGLTIHYYDDTDDPAALLASAVGPGRLGVDKMLRAKFLLPLMERLPRLNVVVGSAVVDDARCRKDAEEQELMRRASALNDASMKEILCHLGDGLSERAMVRLLGDIQVAMGADVAYDHSVCFGINSANTHHDSGGSKLKPGDVALFDVFAPVRRYWCDMTRTVFYRSVSDRQREVYAVVHEANLAGIAAVRPGDPISAVDRAARGVIEKAGYGEYFTHRTGHGIGLSIHEPPDCSGVSHTILEPGMCFSVEPGIYLPGEFGIRIEDLVLITETGVEVLNHFTKELTVVE